MLKQLLTLSLLLLLATNISFAQEMETRSFENFDEIAVSGTIKILLVKSEVNEAEIEVKDADLNDLEMEVKRNTLKIGWKKSRRNQNSWDEDQPKAYITLKYKELNEINASAAAMVESDGPIKAESFEVDASSAAQCDLEVYCTDLEVDVSSAASVEMTGTSERQDIMVTSVGKYEGYEMITKESEVDASSIGQAFVYTTQKIDASATSMGSVKYKGSPDQVKVDESSMGSISKKH